MRWLLLLLCILISVPSFARNDKDEARLRAESCNSDLYGELGVIEEVLAPLPKLRKRILAIMRDESVSEYVKRLIRQTLVEVRPEVIKLDAKTKRKWMVDDELGALSHSIVELRTWGYPGVPQTTNQSIPDSTFPDVTSKYAIAVPDVDSPENFLHLIHELAHLRFLEFLEKNFEAICRRLPESFSRYYDGKCRMNDQLYELLEERFAYETQYRIFREVMHNHYPRSYFSIDMRLVDRNFQPSNRRIGHYITKEYGIRVPQVLALKFASVSDIMLNRNIVKDVNEAVHIYTDPEHLPTREELPIALALVKQLRGFEERINITTAIRDLTKLPNGNDRASHFVDRAIQWRAEQKTKAASKKSAPAE